MQEAKVFPCYDRNERGKGPLEWTRKKFLPVAWIIARKTEVVTKEAVSAHKEKQTELEQTELPDQDPTDKKILQRKF